MEFKVLGPIELYDNVNQRRVALSSHKQRAVLGALIVKCGSPVSAEQMSEEVWGDARPRASANALHAQIHRLRRMMNHMLDGEGASPQFLITEGSGYLLRVDAAQIDSEVFAHAIDRARHTAAQDPVLAEKIIRDALKLWRGQALQGCHGPLCTAEAVRLEETRLSALEILYDASLRAGMHANVITELEELTNSYPLRERFYDQLMIALYRCGHQAQALSVYERARRHLANELGLTPVPALSRRMEQVLSHSPDLLDTQTWGTAELRGPQQLVQQAPSPPTMAPVPYAMPRPATGIRRRPDHGGSGPARDCPEALRYARAASSVDTELRRLHLRVEELTSQQQALITLVQQLSTQLEGVIEGSKEHRPHPAGSRRQPLGEPRLLRRAL